MIEQGPQLRDIHLPADPGWWPPQPGWWLLAVLLLLGLVWLARALYPLWRRQRLRRHALAELDAILLQAAGNASTEHSAQQISALLRRVALLRAPQATRFQGEQWLDWLDSCDGGEWFRRGAGREVLEAAFRPQAGLDVAALGAPLRRWLNKALS